jgi:hypothetical protein
MILGEMCVLVLSLIYSYVPVLGSVSYVVSLLCASLCYFLITGLVYFNIFVFFVLYFLFYILCILCV